MLARPLRSVSLAGLVALGACETTPPEPPPPPFSVELDHFVGNVRTGPLARSGPDAEAEPWIAELRIARLDAPLSAGGTPLSAGARHVFLERGGETLETRSELALGAVEVPGSPLPPWVVWSQRRRTALLPGATAAWRTSLEPHAEVPLNPAWESLEYQVSRDDGGVELALVLEGPVAPRYEDDEGNVRYGDPVPRREHLVLGSAPELNAAPHRVFLPAGSVEAPEGGLLLELRLTAATDEDVSEVVARAREDLERARRRAREEATGLTSSESFRFESEGALRALENPNLQRPALVFLAQQTTARFTGELALSADEDVLTGFLAAVRERLHEGIRVDEPVALGWFLDQTAYLWVAAVAEDPERELAPELRALLLVHTGELGRYPDLVKEIVTETEGLAALDERLLQENRIFLEDGHPAARVRAFDWLAARDAAPSGYDPLGTLAARRSSLAAADEADAEGGE